MKSARIFLCFLLVNGGYGCATSKRINTSVGPANAKQFNFDANEKHLQLFLKDGRKMAAKDPVLEIESLNPLLTVSLFVPTTASYDNAFRLPVARIQMIELEPRHENSHGIGLLEGAGIGLGTGLGLGFLLSPNEGLGRVSMTGLGLILGMLIGAGVGRDEEITHVYDFSGYKTASP